MQHQGKTVFSLFEIQIKILDMDRELRFLWTEAQEEKLKELRARKLKQFWELFRTYRRHKSYLLALHS